jgi:hypothetical protein
MATVDTVKINSICPLPIMSNFDRADVCTRVHSSGLQAFAIVSI